MGCGPRFRQGENVAALKVEVNKAESKLIETGPYKVNVISPKTKMLFFFFCFLKVSCCLCCLLFVCFFLFETESNFRSCCTLISEASYVTHYTILNVDRRDRRIKSPRVSPA